MRCRRKLWALIAIIMVLIANDTMKLDFGPVYLEKGINTDLAFMMLHQP